MAANDSYFMSEAIKLAWMAYCEGEVPVGAVITKNNNIIAVGRNRRETKKNALFHAEIEAINNACNVLNGWRLWECELFVTLEPCLMCAGAIINSRIKRVVFGAKDLKFGSCGSVINLFEENYNHKPEIKSGILKEECAQLLINFFKKVRSKNNYLVS
ncbi:cytidine and deoxycytidylate deaminase zinc-binding region [Clostridium sp. CAG:557]|nr:cytidine and deoxycytidylate deaminase zinc-binding region [Clostridium sp. CAG:557]